MSRKDKRIALDSRPRHSLAACGRAGRANVRHDHASEARRVEALGDDIGLELRLSWHAIWPNGFPEGIALHFVGIQSEVSPPPGPLQLICTLDDQCLGGAGGRCRRGLA